LIRRLDRELALTTDALGGRVRIVVSADHGHVAVPADHHHLLQADDPLLDLLKVPPTGESRNPIFHIREGAECEFVAAFENRFRDEFLLAEPSALESERLLGPPSLAPVTRSRLGNFVGIAIGTAAIEYIPEDGESKNHIGMHGGLSKDEIRVPLFLH
jgi:hypothetical protein